MPNRTNQNEQTKPNQTTKHPNKSNYAHTQISHAASMEKLPHGIYRKIFKCAHTEELTLKECLTEDQPFTYCLLTV